MKNIILCLFLLLITFSYPDTIFSAEVLQVKDSSTLIIGDQNRNYTVKIACLEVESAKENIAKSYLQDILPRHSKVNLRPRGSLDGILISRVIKIDSNNDIGDYIISAGYASSGC
tara:strand:+ start:5651 stop:5995 length:345 start_codon:yes stop_codon:yes gene_type:complete